MLFSPDNVLDLLSDLPEPLIVTTVSGEIAVINKALSALSGFSSQDLVGQHVTRLMPQSERRRLDVVQWLARWADDPNPEQLRYLTMELVTKAGEQLQISIRVSRYESQGESWFLVVLRDVTSEQQTLNQLRHAQLVANRILAIGEDAIISIDADQTISFWNRRAQELFGYSEEEALGKPLGLILPKEFTSSHGSFVADFLNSTENSRLMGQRGEITGVTKSGREIPLEAAITKTVIEGQPVLSAQVRDISERKIAEAALRDSEARFRSLFEHAFEAIVLLDPAGKVLEINQAATGMLPDYETGKYFWELNWWHESGGEDLKTYSGGLMETVQEVQAGGSLRTQVDLRNGDDIRKVDFSLRPVTHTNGQVIYIIAEGRDITAL
jgi:PAS domain S-box-containing protein